MWTTILVSSLVLYPDPAPLPDGGGQIEVECDADLSSQSDRIARLCPEASAPHTAGASATGSGNLVILVPIAAATAARIGLAKLKQYMPASR